MSQSVACYNNFITNSMMAQKYLQSKSVACISMDSGRDQHQIIYILWVIDNLIINFGLRKSFSEFENEKLLPVL